MNRFKRWTIGIVGIALSISAGAAELQWGFDFTSDPVSNQNGGIVANDGTGGANLNGQVGTGAQTPVYTSDIPPASWRQNTTGIGAVNSQSPPGGDVDLSPKRPLEGVFDELNYLVTAENLKEIAGMERK